jgi:hypothetical protein
MVRAFFVRRERRNPVPRAPHLQPTRSDRGGRSDGIGGTEAMGGDPLSPTGTTGAPTPGGHGNSRLTSSTVQLIVVFVPGLDEEEICE